MTSLKFRSDINALRAYSVLLVVLYHFKIPFFGGGFIGVDIFFVISGYLMTRILMGQLESGGVRYVAFMLARVRRIVPTLVVVVLATLLLGAWLLTPLDLRGLAREAVFALTFSSNVNYLTSLGYFRQLDVYRWLLHTWSLSVEWQFYLLYPFVVMLAGWLHRRLAGRRTLTAPSLLLVILAALAALSFGLNVDAVAHGNASSAFYLLHFRAWEMIAGALVALLPGRFAEPRKGAWYAALGWGVLFAAAYLTERLSWQWRWPGYVAALPVAGAMLVIYGQGTRNAIESSWIVDRIGRCSYAWYLWHWPIVVYLKSLQETGTVPLGWTLAALALSLACAVLTYAAIERRVQDSASGSRAVVHRAVAVSLVSAAALVATLEVSNGLEARFGSRQAFFRSLRVAVDQDRRLRGCSNDRTEPRSVETCTIDRGTARRVLVIGDSFAHHLYPWFERYAPVTVDFYSRAGCAAFRHFGRDDQWERCTEYGELAWDKAESAPYDTVIVASNWHTARSLIPGPGAPCLDTHPQVCEPGKPLDRADPAVESLRESIGRLLQRGKRVVFIDAHQVPGFDVPLRLSREMARHGRADLRLDARQGLERSSEVDSMIREFERHPRFVHVSFRDEVCASGRCPLFDAALGTPVFRDDSHFDVTWLLRHGAGLHAWAASSDR